jgi:hypothetical protein
VLGDPRVYVLAADHALSPGVQECRDCLRRIGPPDCRWVPARRLYDLTNFWSERSSLGGSINWPVVGPGDLGDVDVPSRVDGNAMRRVDAPGLVSRWLVPPTLASTEPAVAKTVTRGRGLDPSRCRRRPRKYSPTYTLSPAASRQTAAARDRLPHWARNVPSGSKTCTRRFSPVSDVDAPVFVGGDVVDDVEPASIGPRLARRRQVAAVL